MSVLIVLTMKIKVINDNVWSRMNRGAHVEARHHVDARAPHHPRMGFLPPPRLEAGE